VFHARLPAERDGSGFHSSHADALQQPDGRQISRVSDGDDLRNGRALKDEADRFTHGFGSESNSLGRDIQREADLRLSSVCRDPDPNVTDQGIGAAVSDAKLHPPSAWKQRDSAHFGDELRGFQVRLRFPSLIEPDLRVPSIGLKRWKISERKSSQ
jgi:hypothetical protein